MVHLLNGSYRCLPKGIGQFKYKDTGVWLKLSSSMITNENNIIHKIESEKNVGAIIEGENNQSLVRFGAKDS